MGSLRAYIVACAAGLFFASGAVIRAPSAFKSLVRENIFKLNAVPGSASLGSSQISHVTIQSSDFSELLMESLSNGDMILTIEGMKMPATFRYSVAQPTAFFTYRDSGSGSAYASGKISLQFGSTTNIPCNSSGMFFELRLNSERSRLRNFISNAVLRMRQEKIEEMMKTDVCNRVRTELAKVLGTPAPIPTPLPSVNIFFGAEDILGYMSALTQAVERRLEDRYQYYNVPFDMQKLRVPFQNSAGHVSRMVGSAITAAGSTLGDVGAVLTPIANVTASLADVLESKALGDWESEEGARHRLKSDFESVGQSFIGMKYMIPKYIGSIVDRFFDKEQLGGSDAMRPFIEVVRELFDSFGLKDSGDIFGNIGNEVISALDQSPVGDNFAMDDWI